MNFWITFVGLGLLLSTGIPVNSSPGVKGTVVKKALATILKGGKPAKGNQKLQKAATWYTRFKRGKTVVSLIVKVASAFPWLCDESRFSANVADSASFADEFLYMEPNESLLKTNCSSITESKKFIEDFAQNCMNEEGQHIFNITTRRKLELVWDLCTVGSRVNTDYLSEKNCWLNVSSLFKLCDEKYEQFQLAINRDQSLDTLGIFYSYCAFGWHKNCRAGAAKAECSDRAGSFVEYISNQLGGIILSTLNSALLKNCPILYEFDATESSAFILHSSSYAIAVLLFTLSYISTIP